MAKPNPITSYTDKMLDALAKDHEGTMAKIRQRMHDQIPEKGVGPVGQQVVDSLYDIEIRRSLVDIKFFIKFIFKDPDDNYWHLHREFSYTIDPKALENAEAYLWEKAMSLDETEFAQLAMVLT